MWWTRSCVVFSSCPFSKLEVLKWGRAATSSNVLPYNISCNQSSFWKLNMCNISYYKSSSVCLFVCLSVCSLSPPRSFDRSSPNLVGVCRWTSELPLRGSFSKRSTARRVNGSLSLSTILYMCQPHSTQLQKATLLLLHLIRLKGTFCCIEAGGCM